MTAKKARIHDFIMSYQAYETDIGEKMVGFFQVDKDKEYLLQELF